MITIPNSSNNKSAKARNRLLHDKFMFAARTRQNIDVKHKSIIVHDNDPEHYVTSLYNLNNHTGNETPYPFYLQHSELFENAQHTFKQLFGKDPDCLLLHTYKCDDIESSFIFTCKSYIKDAIAKKQIEFEYEINSNTSKIENQIKKEHKNDRPVQDLKKNNNNNKFLVKLPPGIFPVMGCYNNIHSRNDNSRHSSYSLIFGSNYDDELKPKYDELIGESISDDILDPMTESWDYYIGDFKFNDGLPLYCVKKKRLTLERFIDVFNVNDTSNYYRDVNQACCDDFFETICDVVLSYSRGDFLDLTLDEYISCMAHFYDEDRTYTSVENNKDLKDRLEDLYHRANIFASRMPNLTFKDFILFLVSSSVIDFDEFKYNPEREISKAFSDKRPMKQLIGKKQFLTDFLDKSLPNNPKYRDFIDNQCNAKRKLKKLGIH